MLRNVESMTEPSHIVDPTRWPLVYARPPASADTRDASFDVFYAELDAVLARQRPYVALVDIRGVAASEARGQRFARWTARRDGALRKHMVALAYVVQSVDEREYVTAVVWQLKHSYHARVYSELSEAERWLLCEYARHEAAIAMA